MAGLVSINWKNDVGGNFATGSLWSSNTVPNDGDDAVIGQTGFATAFTVTSSASETVGELTIGTANATLAISAGSFTVDYTTAGPSGYYVSEAIDLGTISVASGATFQFGTTADSASGNNAGNYVGELLDSGGKVNIASGGALLIDEPWLTLGGGAGAAGVVTLTGTAVIKGATTISDTLDNVNNVIQGAGAIGNGSASTSTSGLNFINGVNGVIDANAATAMTINTGSAGNENSGLIETTGKGGLTIDSSIDDEGQIVAGGAGALTLNGAELHGKGTVSVSATGSLALNNGELSLSGTLSVAKGGKISTTAGNHIGVGTNNAIAGDAISAGDVENAGTINVVAGSTFNFNASLYNAATGALTLSGAAGKAATLEIYGNGAAIYGGALTLSNSVNNFVVSNGIGQQLSDDSGTISGAGVIGDGFLRLYVAPAGILNANASSLLTIDGVTKGSESADYSAGLVETTGTGGLTINGDFGNAGLLEATGTGKLTLENGKLTSGGTLETTKAGATIVLDNFVSDDNVTKIVAGSALTTTAGDNDQLVEVENAGTVTVAKGSTLGMYNWWQNSGAIKVNASGATIEIYNQDGGLVLTGGGTLTLGGSADVVTGSATSSSSGGYAYFENVNNTISGSGLFGSLTGATNLQLSNSGLIDATGAAGAALKIDTGAQTVYNNGEIETTGAGGLTFYGTIGLQNPNFNDLQNDGSLVADGTGALTFVDDSVTGNGSVALQIAAAQLILQNSTLDTSGAIATVAGSKIEAEGTADSLAGGQIDNAGSIIVAGGATMTMDGYVDDTGTIMLGTAASAATLRISQNRQGELEFFGSGKLVMAANAGSLIEGSGAGFAQTLINGSNIYGAGTIGGAGLYLENEAGGLIDADDGIGLMIVADGMSGPGNTNGGEIETTGAGGLTIEGQFDNSGLLVADGKGALTLDNVSNDYSFGEIEASASGAEIVFDNTNVNNNSVVVVAGATLLAEGTDDAVNRSLTNHGAIQIANGATLQGASIWNNTGAINIGSGNSTSAASLQDTGGMQLNGGGKVTLANMDDAIDGVTSTMNFLSFFTNVNDTIQGVGTIGDTAPDMNFVLTNEVGGVIDATGAAGHALTIVTTGDAITNAGTIETTGAGGLMIESWMNLSGSLIAKGTGALTISAATFVSAEGGGNPNGGGAVISGQGTLSVASGASVLLSNAALNLNGRETIAAGGSIVALSNTTDELEFGEDLENAGAIKVQDGATLFIASQVFNSGAGAIDIGDGQGQATLEITSWGTQVNSGQIVLGAGSQVIGNGTNLNLWTSATISGAGTIGDATLSLQNLSGGVVDANKSQTLTIVLNNSSDQNSVYNAGTFETTAAGGLLINGEIVGGSKLDNADYLIASGAGALTLDDVDVDSGGGIVEATGTGSSIVLENNTIISHQGYVSIGAGDTLTTTTGDSDDAIYTGVINAGALDIVDGSTLIGENHWTNSGSIDIGSTMGGRLEVQANETLQLLGGGTVTMSAGSSIAGQGGANPDGNTVLRNVSDTIEGQGTIGDGDAAIWNANGATIDATTGAMTITSYDPNNSVSSAGLVNSGLIQSDSTGGIDLASDILNNGQITANRGAILFSQADMGSGAVTINSHGTVEFAGSAGNDVTFGSAGGGLVLDHSATAGDDPSILGFDASTTALDTIDLKDINFASTSLSLGYAGGAYDGILTVTDGTNTANLYLVGDYSKNSFSLSADSGTGTLIKGTGTL